jgi:hypothetical protein
MRKLLAMLSLALASCGGDRPPNCTIMQTGKTVVEQNVRVHSKTEYDVVIEACTYYHEKRINPRKIK